MMFFDNSVRSAWNAPTRSACRIPIDPSTSYSTRIIIMHKAAATPSSLVEVLEGSDSLTLNKIV